MSADSVGSAGGLRVVHDDTLIAQIFTVSRRITERITCEVNICHCIRTDEVENSHTKSASLTIEFSIASIRISFLVRLDKIEHKVEEG